MKVKLKHNSIDYSPEAFEKIYDVAYIYLMPSHGFTFGVVIDGSIICLNTKHLDFVVTSVRQDWKIRFVREEESDFANFSMIIGPEIVMPNGNLYEIVQKDTAIGNPLYKELLNELMT